MSKELIGDEKSTVKRPKPVDKAPDKQHPVGPTTGAAALLNLQRQVGNQAVQRLIAQRQGEEGFDLDESTSDRINRARGGGQPLDGAVQKQMGAALGHDFSSVRVHTSPEADTLNQELSAKAFTTGQDVFFKQGTYDPGSSAGKELIAHELTHVVQQSSGRVDGSGSGMTVRPAGDAFEQEADAVAQQAVNMNGEAAQTKADETIQRQDEEELEGEVMTKRDEAVQRQDEEELEGEVMTKRDEAVQRQDEEELEDEVMTKRDEAVQRQTDGEEFGR